MTSDSHEYIDKKPESDLIIIKPSDQNINNMLNDGDNFRNDVGIDVCNLQIKKREQNSVASPTKKFDFITGYAHLDKQTFVVLGNSPDQTVLWINEIETEWYFGKCYQRAKFRKYLYKKFYSRKESTIFWKHPQYCSATSDNLNVDFPMEKRIYSVSPEYVNR